MPVTPIGPWRSSFPWASPSRRRYRSSVRWQRCGREPAKACCLVPRELRTAPEAIDRLTPSNPQDIPTLYLYGEETDASIFATPDEVAEMLPKAQLHGLPGQRHLACAFDPTSFAQAVLEFTTANDL